MQIGPVRWVFIKSPNPRQPYTNIKKIYEIELSNSKANRLSDLEKEDLLALREKTKRVLKKKQRQEAIYNIIVLTGLLTAAIVVVYLLIK